MRRSSSPILDSKLQKIIDAIHQQHPAVQPDYLDPNKRFRTAIKALSITESRQDIVDFVEKKIDFSLLWRL